MNATLTRVLTYTFENVGGEMVETEVEKWLGSVDAFTTEKNSIEAGPAGITNVYQSTIALPAPLGTPPISIEVGDRLVFERNGETQTRQVDATEDRLDFGFVRCFVSEPD